MKDFKEISTRLKIAKKNVRETEEKNRGFPDNIKFTLCQEL